MSNENLIRSLLAVAGGINTGRAHLDTLDKEVTSLNGALVSYAGANKARIGRQAALSKDSALAAQSLLNANDTVALLLSQFPEAEVQAVAGAMLEEQKVAKAKAEHEALLAQITPEVKAKAETEFWRLMDLPEGGRETLRGYQTSDPLLFTALLGCLDAFNAGTLKRPAGTGLLAPAPAAEVAAPTTEHTQAEIEAPANTPEHFQLKLDREFARLMGITNNEDKQKELVAFKETDPALFAALVARFAEMLGADEAHVGGAIGGGAGSLPDTGAMGSAASALVPRDPTEVATEAKGAPRGLLQRVFGQGGNK